MRDYRPGSAGGRRSSFQNLPTPWQLRVFSAYESDNESDDAVDDQKGRRRQPESDEARAVHILRCLSRESQGAPPSRAQVQRPKKKDLSYCSLNIRGRAPPHGPRSSRGGALAFLMADPASGRCWLFYYPSLTSLLVLLRPVDKPNFNILDPQGPVPRKLLASSKALAQASCTLLQPGRSALLRQLLTCNA